MTDEERIDRLEKLLDTFTISTAGSLRQGYAIDISSVVTAPLVLACFSISVSATVSGIVSVTGVACAGSCNTTAIFSEVLGPGMTVCCDDPCNSFNVQDSFFVSFPSGVPCSLCVEAGANFTSYVELDFVDPDYELLVQGNFSAGLASNPPDCNLGVCGVGGSTEGNTYNLGPDPTGTHNISFVGGTTGATYDFTIIIS